MKKTIIILALAAFLPISVQAQTTETQPQDAAGIFAETGYDALVKAMIPAFQREFEQTSGAPKEISDAAAAVLLAKTQEPDMEKKAKVCFQPSWTQQEIMRCLEPWSAEVQTHVKKWIDDNKKTLSQQYMARGKVPYAQLADRTLRDIFGKMPADFPAAEREPFKKTMTTFLHSEHMQKLAAPCLDFAQVPPEKLKACLKPWMDAWGAKGRELTQKIYNKKQ